MIRGTNGISNGIVPVKVFINTVVEIKEMAYGSIYIEQA